jgi:hypothetical protein
MNWSKKDNRGADTKSMPNVKNHTLAGKAASKPKLAAICGGEKGVRANYRHLAAAAPGSGIFYREGDAGARRLNECGRQSSLTL